MSKTEDNAGSGEWSALAINERAEGVRISVQVRPRSSRSAILGVRDGTLDIALMSPPVDGAANAELVKLLARSLDVHRNHVEVALGTSSRNKVVAIHGLNGLQMRARLAKARR